MARARKMDYDKELADSALSILRTYFPTPHHRKLYALTRRTTSRNAAGHYSFFIADGHDVIDVTWAIGRVLDNLYDDNDCWTIRVSGVGFNRPEHIRQRLSQVLFGDRMHSDERFIPLGYL